MSRVGREIRDVPLKVLTSSGTALLSADRLASRSISQRSTTTTLAHSRNDAPAT